MARLVGAIAASFFGGLVGAYITGDDEARHKVHLASPFIVAALFIAMTLYEEPTEHEQAFESHLMQTLNKY
jgi:hypothetical protein